MHFFRCKTSNHVRFLTGIRMFTLNVIGAFLSATSMFLLDGFNDLYKNAGCTKHTEFLRFATMYILFKSIGQKRQVCLWLLFNDQTMLHVTIDN